MVPWYPPTIQQQQKQQQVASSSSSSSSMATASTIPDPATTSSSVVNDLFLNGPDSEPVLYQPSQHSKFASSSSYKNNNNVHNYEDSDNNLRCRSCHSTEIVTDWKQGDRICTNCGVVVDEHILDDRPEWREFNDVEDLIKGAPSGARSGLVLVDESKYLGGLQPTRLSKETFGGDNSLIALSKKLKTTNKRMDQFMEKQHKKALKDAKLDRAIRLKHGNTNDNTNDTMDGNIRPEMDSLILQEEEDAHRMHAALYAEKWSLDRAILLHGGEGESTSTSSFDGASPERQEEREELLGRLDSTLRKASEDMYTAYTMLLNGAQKLHLPDRVRIEVVHRLVRFATRRDGFFVKGVSSRLSKSHNDPNHQRKKAAEQLREYNKLKQMGALGAGILFLTARSLGWTRSVAEVCASMQPPATMTISTSTLQQQDFIKTKHCSRAMTEIKTTFPEYARVHTSPPAPNVAAAGATNTNIKTLPSPATTSSNGNDALATSNFADHSLRRLQLPPVAEACARTLLWHCRNQQVQLGQNSGTKLSTLCAAVTYFTCAAGTIMRRLAQQTTVQSFDVVKKTKKSNKKRTYGDAMSSAIPRKRLKMTPPKSSGSSHSKDEGREKVEDSNQDSDEDSDDSMDAKSKQDDDDEDEEEEPFDVFSHAPIVEDQTEKHKYEMRRMWDAWAEQMPWARSVSEVEQSCGVSRNVILEFYKTQLYPQRNELLKVLGDAVTAKRQSNEGDDDSSNISMLLQDTPMARILLVHISTAAPLMSAK